jgi:hypothetical protein
MGNADSRAARQRWSGKALADLFITELGGVKQEVVGVREQLVRQNGRIHAVEVRTTENSDKIGRCEERLTGHGERLAAQESATSVSAKWQQEDRQDTKAEQREQRQKTWEIAKIAFMAAGGTAVAELILRAIVAWVNGG